MRTHALKFVPLVLLLGAAIVLGGCVHYQPNPLDAARTEDDLNSRTLADAGLKAFIAINAPELAKEWPRSNTRWHKRNPTNSELCDAITELEATVGNLC